MSYRGRFAPSPTGSLHFGSLIAALASYLQARSQQGQWLVRIEDIDPPREVSGSADEILRTLDCLGLHWDETVLYQSTRFGAYDAALDTLKKEGRSFQCSCSRKDFATAGQSLYPGTCREQPANTLKPHSTRLRVEAKTVRVADLVQGIYAEQMNTDVGDFVIRRADGLYTYHLAAVVDDAWQGITEVVRGADLLSSTPRQVFLQSCLHLGTPEYLHVPMATDSEGIKLSKQAAAIPVDPLKPSVGLVAALNFLNQNPPCDLAEDPVETVVTWATENWRVNAIPKRPAISVVE